MSILTVLRIGRLKSRGLTSCRIKNASFTLQNVQTGPGTHEATYPLGTLSLSLGQSGQGVEPSVYVHIAPGEECVELSFYSGIYLRGLMLRQKS